MLEAWRAYSTRLYKLYAVQIICSGSYVHGTTIWLATIAHLPVSASQALGSCHRGMYVAESARASLLIIKSESNTHIKKFWAKTIMVLTGAHNKLLSRLAE